MPESTDGESTSASPDQEGKKLSIADIIDNQLETSDEIEIGRVADIEAEWREDGSLVLTQVVTGPQALARRVASRLEPLFKFLFRDRFEHRLPLSEVEDFGPTLRLRSKAATTHRAGHGTLGCSRELRAPHCEVEARKRTAGEVICRAYVVAVQNSLKLLGIDLSAETTEKLLKPFEGKQLGGSDVQAILEDTLFKNGTLMEWIEAGLKDGSWCLLV